MTARTANPLQPFVPPVPDLQGHSAPPALRLAERARQMEPFYVMEVSKAASLLAASLGPDDAPMIYLNIGEPDFTAPPKVQEAAARAIHKGHTQYTHATGLHSLRERISGWYQTRFGLRIPARRIVVTAGASAALQLICLALIEAGDEILMSDPCYPCNRQFVNAANGRAVLLPSTAQERFQLTADKVRAAWTPRTRGVLLASPSNPTGTSLDPAEFSRIHEVVSQRGGVSLVDEIYLGLSHDDRFGQSALALDDQVISINSFSKYFNMTGWRLGWLVVPEALVDVVERIAQHLFICPSSVAQHAALACFEADSLAEFERRRSEFKARRDYFIPALKNIGISVPVMPDGAFYAWADCSDICSKLDINGSWDFAFRVMQQAHIAITPGRDFGLQGMENYVRFSTANSLPQLQESIQRLGRMFGSQR